MQQLQANSMQQLETHEYANLFPMIEGDDFERLKADIKANGLQEAIWLYQGKILDGRNRYKACLAAGVVPEFREYTGSEPLKFVMSLNLARRHLNSSQLAFVALEAEKILAKEAKERQVEAVKQGNVSRHELPVKEKIPELANNKNQELTEPQARDKAAELVGGTNARYVQDAKKIEREAPEVKELVMSGKLNMPDAAKVAKLELGKRQSIIAKIEANPDKVDEVLKTVRGTLGTGENEWYTPQDYIELARTAMLGIDLDPASSAEAQKKVRAGQFFTQEMNGLEQQWEGSVWLNPPYSQPLISQFMEKLCSEYLSGRCTQAISLTHNYTDTKWFQDAALHASAICFTRGRIRFYSPSGEIAAPTQGQVFMYFGTSPEKFIDSFKSIGLVVRV